MNSFIRLTVTVVLTITCAATAARGVNLLTPPGPEPFAQLNHDNGLSMALDGIGQLAAWDKQLDAWRTAEVYRKVSAAGLLLERLDDSKAVAMEGFEPKPGKHNLHVKAGRTAAAIEAIYNIRLSSVGASPTPAELASIRREAEAALAAYREAACALAAEYGVGRPIEYLKRTYLGKVTPRIKEEANRQAEAMNRLLGEWFPIGKRLTELEAIAGPPDRKGGDKWEYRYDNGWNGTAFVFRYAEGRITSVTTWGIY